MTIVTTILKRMQAGDSQAADELLPLVYDELRRIAARHMRAEKAGHTLQATALVHEAWMRLAANPSSAAWETRQRFFAAAAESMRRILVDAARKKSAMKRGGAFTRSTLDASEQHISNRVDEVLAVSEALTKLEKEDPVAAELVKFHYFAGFSLEESGELLDLSRASAYRVWTFAKTFLRAELSK